MKRLRNSALVLLALASVLWLTRAPGDPALFPPEPGQPSMTIHVVDYGWHTGLILRTDDLRAAAHSSQDSAPDEAIVLFDLLRQMGQVEWLEIGWGDEAFYRSNVAGLWDVPLWTGLKALFGSSSTLFHIFPGAGDPRATFPASDMIRLDLSEQGYRVMASRLAQGIERASDGTIRDIGPGLYAGSRFYAANGRYSAFQTCNSWVSGMLRSAGVASSGTFATLSIIMMEELRLRASVN